MKSLHGCHPHPFLAHPSPSTPPLSFSPHSSSSLLPNSPPSPLKLLLFPHPTLPQLVTTCKDVPFKYKVKIPSCTFLKISGSYSFLNPHFLTFIKMSNKQAVNVRLIVWYTLFTVIGRDGDRIQQIPCPSCRSSGERPRLPQETRERYVRRYPSKSNLQAPSKFIHSVILIEQITAYFLVGIPGQLADLLCVLLFLLHDKLSTLGSAGLAFPPFPQYS